MDLPRLDRVTRTALDRAGSDAEASAAITAFVTAFHDGHFVPASVPVREAPAGPEPDVVEGTADARTACAAYGYAPITRIAFSLPFETLTGFTLLADGLGEPFRTGVIDAGGRQIGLIRIPRFRPAEFPTVCEQAWTALRGAGVAPTRDAILDAVNDEWLRILATRLRALRARPVSALVIDIGGNGGGNDLGDWTVRLLTPGPVRSAPLLLSANRTAIAYFDEQLGELRRAVAATPPLDDATRAAVGHAIEEFTLRRQVAGGPACDMSWVWRERRPWGTSPCTRLIASGYASGALAYLEPGALDPRAARALYWPAIADSLRGAWSGPAYVLTDGNTGSAAEMFAALMRDRGVAKTIGSHTFGLGCGFMDADAPVVLPHSKRGFRIPNCVRLRGDGTDEVAGVAPDLPATAQPGESARSLAARVLRMMLEDLKAASPR